MGERVAAVMWQGVGRGGGAVGGGGIGFPLLAGSRAFCGGSDGSGTVASPLK